MDSDPLDDVLSLEDKYYSEGHALGVSDGSRAGRIEGRIFGLEKGFEKFVAMGALGGRSTVWASRIVRRASAADGGKDMAQVGVETVDAELSEKVTEEPVLPQLADNWRLERHIRTLYALTEPASLSTQNNEDAVSDFDDRIKRAEGKARVIEKIIGENNAESDPEGNQPVRGKKDRRPLRTTGTGTKTESNMEDFGGRRARS
ncbi:hypothetical protein B0A49_13315 [Cryomyces minteri]|uniref:Essential protein Yae1 N-terminal domain-containing protein n=1 Tax=Cryomyces minteri TaxID=331657 RepID=A0A4U0VM55_9PEZI|nr:hypothetical protein B0A49_13315 [Cryomyces minteri]